MSSLPPSLRSLSPSLALRLAATLALAFAAARLCLWLRTPLPWMIGPLVAVSLASVAGAPVASALPLRNAAQWTIGTSLGLYFTPAVVALVATLWWAVGLTILWVIGAGLLAGAWLYRLHAPGVAAAGGDLRALRATTFFAASAGGASEMTVLAERARARTDLVAASHSLRVLVVAVLVPFCLQAAGVHGLDATPPATREVDGLGLAALLALTAAGALLMRRWRQPNPWFLGALATATALTLSGVALSAVPQAASNAAQLLIGAGLGVRFQPAFLRMAPRWMLAVTASTLLVTAACAAFGMALSWLTALHWGTLVLATSPGGLSEMSITAKMLQLGVPVVTAFQVCRLSAVLVAMEPLYRWLYGNAALDAAPAQRPDGDDGTD
ncbi:MAG: AbrB family transcriptional regulator [Xylophilus ampelinus]